MTTCLACHDQPVTDTFVCTDCQDDYHGLLPRVPDLARDLDIEITRQARKGGGGEGGRTRSFERPLEYNPAASDALAQLRVVLVSTCLTLALGQRLPADTIDAMVEWLITNEAAVPLRPEAGDMIIGLQAAVRRGQAVIDNPPERVMIGQCDCGTDMLAPRDAQVYRCTSPQCGAEWDVPSVLAWRDELAQDHLLPLSDIAVVAGIPKGTLKSWVKRGRLVHHGADRDGVRLYRYGAVVDMRKAG